METQKKRKRDGGNVRQPSSHKKYTTPNVCMSNRSLRRDGYSIATYAKIHTRFLVYIVIYERILNKNWHRSQLYPFPKRRRERRQGLRERAKRTECNAGGGLLLKKDGGGEVGVGEALDKIPHPLFSQTDFSLIPSFARSTTCHSPKKTKKKRVYTQTS